MLLSLFLPSARFVCLLLPLFFPASSPSPVPVPSSVTQTLLIETSSRQRDFLPESVLAELSAHFAALDGPRLGRVSRQLRRAKELAHRMEYGQRPFNLDSEEDRQKSISISMLQPNTSVAMTQLLFEGDILLTEQQLVPILAKLLAKEEKQQQVYSKRSLSADPNALWPKLPIKFFLHESLELSAVHQVAEAIAFWENNSCIRFQHIEREPTEDELQDFVQFFKGQGCYSMIGHYGGKQGVSIGAGCERVVGIVEHEIGHLLGLWHEQSRPDAWKYVRVEKDFILPSYMADFQLRGPDEVATLELPYDYGSVMHYGPTAFSADGTSVTLMTKNILFQSTIGQRDRLAFLDLMSVNKAYCADKCGGIAQLKGERPTSQGTDQQQADCLNGGYPNPGNCSECLCPSGYGGSQCQKVQDSTGADCGGQRTLQLDEWTLLESPDFSGEGYRPGQHCNWLVRSPNGTRIQLEFIDDFSLLCATICVDFVELKLARDQRPTGARFCCDKKPKGWLISEHNQIAVLFRAQLAPDIGFRMRLRPTHLPATNRRTGKNSPQEKARTQNGGQSSLAGMTRGGKGQWSPWAAWSACSRPCGGCGLRSRVRSCLGGDCPSGKAQEFSACNFHACPVGPDCQRVMFLNRLCHNTVTDSPPVICSQPSLRLAHCNQPSCCPPFYALDGQCVADKFGSDSR